MNNRSFDKSHLRFLLVGILLVVVIEKSLYSGVEPKAPPAIEPQAGAVVHVPVTGLPEKAAADSPKPLVLASLKDKLTGAKDEEPLWKKNAVKVVLDPNKPKIAIVIDDLGVSRAHTKEVLQLPGPLTLAFLPYATHVRPLVEEGRKNGNEIMIHMPMEPLNPDLDMGGIYLSTEEGPAEFDAMLQKGLSAFDGYVGMNNHMGSRLTQDKDAMDRVMAELYKRGMLFLDSRTIGGSVAAKTAKQYQVPYASRDVFLDDDESLEAVHKSLAKTERLARKYGQAIAIGHPKRHTIDALKEWLPQAVKDGFQLVPISAVVKVPEATMLSGAQEQPDQSPAPQRQ